MTPRNAADFEPQHVSSPTARIIDQLQLHGYRPHQDEPDPRPLPDEEKVRGALADIFDALVSTLNETRLEPDLDDLLWGCVNLFHRAADRIQRECDRNEDEQKRSQKEQDGSEIRSVELERLIVQGMTMIERRNCMEFFRDQAADLFEAHTGSTWRPRAGSRVNHRALTAAMIDSRDFLAAKRRVENEPLMPAGTKVAFAGGIDCNDYGRIWDVLDKVLAKHPDMVLLHGASPKGAEFIAARWADARKVVQITFKPDWTRHAKAAPFKRNDQLLQTLPIGEIVGDAGAGEDDDADRQGLQKLVVALERRGFGVAGPVGLESYLSDIAGVGPARGDELGALGRGAVQQNHVGMLGAHLVEDIPDAGVVVAVETAGEGDLGSGGYQWFVLDTALGGDKIAAVDHRRGECAVVDLRACAETPG